MPQFVNSITSNSGASTVTTLAASYSSAGGNIVLIGLRMQSAGATGITCTDDVGNSLTQVSTGAASWLFAGRTSAAALVYTFNWTTAKIANLILAEYTSVNSFGAINQSSSGTSVTPSLTVTPTQSNSFIVAFLGVQGFVTFSNPVGTQRASVTNGAGNQDSQVLIDNVSGNVGAAITNSATISGSSNWVGVGVELIDNALFTAPTVSPEFHWGGGDGW